jgi:hypothetical protein
MAGFFYLSKPECWLKGDKGVFIIYSPVIEYYGPRRDQPLACAETGGPVPDDPDLGDPYNSSSFSDTQTTGTQCSSDGGSGPSDGQTSNCYKAWVTVEVTHDGGATWQVEWEGWVSFCL